MLFRRRYVIIFLMEIRIEKTRKQEAAAVAEMYRQGSALLLARGVDQWQNGYPALKDVLSDIEAGISFLLFADGEPAASMAIVSREPTYDRIYGGNWLTGEGRYLAVHRVCVRDGFRRLGLTGRLYAFAAEKALQEDCVSLRADTHEKNIAMRGALAKNGFRECGRIFLADGAERVAYEKILTKEEVQEMQTEKKRLVVATGNAHKLREIAEIFPDCEVIGQKAAGFDGEAEETGTTFAENALIKARTAAKALGCPALADDSGICVEALGGAPGVYSARYAGGHGDDAANRALLLKNLEGAADRRAYFESAVALVYPDGREIVAQGRTYGEILSEDTGENGFGYDCIFRSDDLGKSFGLASAEEKNAVSHRYRALRNLLEKLGGSL